MSAVLEVTFGIWEGFSRLGSCDEYEAVGVRAAERSLRELLEAFWVELKPNQRAVLLRVGPSGMQVISC
jgi:hypothetical protein